MPLYKNKTLLITGDTGSFGNAVHNHFLATNIGETGIISRDEKKQDEMCDLASIKNARHGVDYIFHVQLPSCEAFRMDEYEKGGEAIQDCVNATIISGGFS